MARRRAGRRARRVNRITPRRWLPFLALLAITAGAVVLAQQDSEPVPVGAVVVPSARLPVAAQPDALSTAWYCAGGTAQGPDGPAELSVVIANEAGRGATADVVVVGSNGERRRTSVEVPATGRTRVVGSDILKSEWIAMTIEVLGGRATVEREVTGPHGVDVSPCSTNASARWYIPSGSSVRGATEQLALFNPFPDATSVDISFSTDEGRRSPRALQGLSIPGRSLRMVPAENFPARRPEIATKLAARTGRIVVDRVQIYDGTGDPAAGSGDNAVATPAPEGLASTAAIPALSSRWLFPEVIKSPGTRTQVAVFNPSGSEAEVDLVITYEQPDRSPPTEPVQLTVRAGEQRLVDLTDLADIAEGIGFTVDIRSLQGVPVVAEQLVFGAVPTAPAPDEAPAGEAPPDAPVTPGYAVVPGSPIAASAWLLASRGGSTARVASVVVANPGAAKVSVQVDQIVEGKRSAVKGATVTIPARDRRTLDLRAAAINPALLIRAEGPVVVGHSAVVADGIGVVWALATPLPETVVALPPVG